MPARRIKSLYKAKGHRAHREHRSRKGRQNLSAHDWKQRKYNRLVKENRKRRETNRTYKEFFNTSVVPKRWDDREIET